MDTSTNALAKPENKGEIVIYQSEGGKIELGVQLNKDTVWLAQKQMAKLFKKGIPAINEHIANIYREGELEKNSTIRKFRIVQQEKNRLVKRSIDFYNLDVIISVGYRVKSLEGIRFRQWATGVLRDHIIKGYTVNKDRLAELDRLYSYVSDTMRVTTMSINRLMIDSARQKDLAVLAEDVEEIKKDLEVIKKRLPEKSE